jgi:hypothetical protein
MTLGEPELCRCMHMNHAHQNGYDECVICECGGFRSIDATPVLEKIDLSKLNPGIRNAVAWFRANGFDTCDSGDGSTHEFDCDLVEPYVHVTLDRDTALDETDRLAFLLENVLPGANLEIQMTYNTDGGAYLSVFGDGLLGLQGAPS